MRLEQALDGAALNVYTVDGRFVTPADARELPLSVAAANWAATAGTGRPIRFRPACSSTSEPPPRTSSPSSMDRLWQRATPTRPGSLSGELVYTGALRTPVEAVAPRGSAVGWKRRRRRRRICADRRRPPLAGPSARARTIPAPRRTVVPPRDESAGERLARIVCADREMLDDSALDDIAAALARAQVGTVVRALEADPGRAGPRSAPRW